MGAVRTIQRKEPKTMSEQNNSRLLIVFHLTLSDRLSKREVTVREVRIHPAIKPARRKCSQQGLPNHINRSCHAADPSLRFFLSLIL